MSKEKVEGKKQSTQYGVYRANTPRYGWCWCYRVRVVEEDGRTHMRAASGFASKAEAEAAVSKLRLDSRARQHGIEIAKPMVVPTVGEAVDAYIRMKEAEWESDYGAAYLHRNKAQLNPLRAWADFAGRDRRLNTVTRDDLTFYMQSESQRGLSKASIKRRLNSIHAVINHARETNPEALAAYRPPRRIVGREADVSRIRVLTEAEIKALSAALAARPEWQDVFDFFLVALGCGGRFDEITPTVIRKQATVGILWERVHAPRGIVELYSYKTRKWRSLNVPAVVEILLRRRADGRGDAVRAFNIRDHKVRAVFEEASTACGIVYGQQVAGGWSAHDLRHTCLTNLLHSGVDLATVRDFAGHASIAETTKYVHSTDESWRLAAQASSALVAMASSAAS